MKKLLSVLLICVILVIGCTSIAMANEIMPLYNEIAAITCGIYPGTRSIEYDVYVYVPSSDTLDSAYIDLELRTTSGKVIATYTSKKMTKGGIYFTYEGATPVTTNGTYFYTYEIRCYKNGLMVDNPTGTSRNLSYTP